MQKCIQIVRQTIEEVASFYESGMLARQQFLSEDDCKCFVYAALYKNLFDDWQTAVSAPISKLQSPNCTYFRGMLHSLPLRLRSVQTLSEAEWVQHDEV
ncbi:hypothetical protein MNBD_CHLOROFLEXI01-3792 [hydrothermal vent metagenome]|uniref:Uncharacterized protein n=1 Tax=hydrothermal vent metagenome TaxID=652676 RepID=A0A3B0WA98_9ZZZZ